MLNNQKLLLCQITALLASAIGCGVIASLTLTAAHPIAVLAITAFIVFLWLAIASALNALAPYFSGRVGEGMHWIYAQSFELVALLALLGMGIASFFRKSPAAKGNSNHCPILLVHGYLVSGYVWEVQKKWLEKKYSGRIYVINLGYPFRTIRDYVEQVKKKVAEINVETGRADVILIGHSMGGLIISYYATKMSPPGTVRAVITIGSPLQGTYVAKIGLGHCARDMEIDSEFIKDLNQALLSRSDISFYNIATKTDQLVIPYTSCLPASNPAHQYLLNDIGHASLLFSKRVSHKIYEWLAQVA